MASFWWLGRIAAKQLGRLLSDAWTASMTAEVL